MLKSEYEILIVEDDPFFQCVLNEALLQIPTNCIVHGCSSGHEALDLCRSSLTCLDLALVDLGLPDIAGLEVIRAIKRRFNDLPIVVVTGCAEENIFLEAVRVGAVGYILKGDSHLSVRQGIEQIMEGVYPISPALAKHLFNLATNGNGNPGLGAPKLSGKELELLTHLASGKSYAESAAAMCVAVSTAQAHGRSLYRKLGVHSQLQALSKARGYGLI